MKKSNKLSYLKISYLAVALATLLTGCSNTKEAPQPTAQQVKPAAAHESAGMPAPSGSGIKFKAPEGWVAEKTTSSMRQAQYKLPRVEGDTEDAEMVVFYFQGGGGGVQANVDRWIAQFSKPDGSPAADQAKVAHKQVHGIPLTVVDVSGIYDNSMGPDSATKPKSTFRLLGAVAEAGNGPWFMKLTGPAKTVAKWESSFQSFLDTIE
jgi:hypothetical protein